MTQRERMLKALSHELPDRIPTVMDARQEVREDLKHFYGVGSFDEALRILGAVNMYRFRTDGLFKISFSAY